MIDRIFMRIAWLLPKRLVFWCSIRLGVYATSGDYRETEVPTLLFMEALERWK